MTYLTFNDVLEKAGITNLNRVLLIRHSFNEDFRKCYCDPIHRDEFVKAYTACQKIKYKDKYDYWAVFISTKGTSAKLYRIYEVGDCVKRIPSFKPENYPVENDFAESDTGSYYYNLKEYEELKEYYGRLVIDWGKAAIQWGQIAGRQPKKIIALMDNEKIPFPGYENVLLTYSQLVEMIDDPITFEAWHAALSSVYGIYLIVNTKEKDGRQYIGSATGENGIMGRWTVYANNHTGGDKLLIELLKEDSEAFKHFQFTILRILPKDMEKNEVLRLEDLYKRKLGSRVSGLHNFGLNAN